jgi:hypothetical protein
MLTHPALVQASGVQEFAWWYWPDGGGILLGASAVYITQLIFPAILVVALEPGSAEGAIPEVPSRTQSVCPHRW